jgi:hypothetical protein
MGKFKVGDKVRVTDVNVKGSRLTRVVSVGRKYVYLACDYGKTQPYDKETGQASDSYGHRRIYTLDEWDLHERVGAASKALREFGVGPVDWCRWSDEKTLAIYQALKPLIEAEKTK